MEYPLHGNVALESELSFLTCSMIQPAFEISDIHVVATLRKIGCIFLLQKCHIGNQICTSVSSILIYIMYFYMLTLVALSLNS